MDKGGSPQRRNAAEPQPNARLRSPLAPRLQRTCRRRAFTQDIGEGVVLSSRELSPVKFRPSVPG